MQPLKSFEAANVLIVGDIMLDRYVRGQSNRVSPEAPVPIVNVEGVYQCPGGAGNVALNVAALGAKTKIISAVGKDDTADQLEKELKSVGVDVHFIQTDYPTIVKQRVVCQNQQLLRLDFEESFSLASSVLMDAYQAQLDWADVVIISDYAKGVFRSGATPLITLARKRGIPVLVDPKTEDFSIYRGATLITPNLKEFERVVGHSDYENALLEKAEALIEAHDLSALLITRGAAGMTLLEKNQPEVYFRAKGRDVFDVTGAGDTVISVIAVALASGYSLEKSVHLGNVAAGIVIGKFGAAVVFPDELQQALSDAPDRHAGVVSEAELIFLLKEARAHQERIVFTNGCFDVLHAMHVEYLQLAKQLGDRLVVAVNDDASIRRLKGDGRPVNQLTHRMSVLAGLQSVDWVVDFSDDTPERLLALIKPDILAKGGDYRVDQVVGADIVTAYGGQVVVLGDTVDGVKSTAIIERMKRLAEQ